MLKSLRPRLLLPGSRVTPHPPLECKLPFRSCFRSHAQTSEVSPRDPTFRSRPTSLFYLGGVASYSRCGVQWFGWTVMYGVISSPPPPPLCWRAQATSFIGTNSLVSPSLRRASRPSCPIFFSTLPNINRRTPPYCFFQRSSVLRPPLHSFLQ